MSDFEVSLEGNFVKNYKIKAATMKEAEDIARRMFDEDFHSLTETNDVAVFVEADSLAS